MATTLQEETSESRPVQVYLDLDEQRMLNELRTLDLRNISDTLRYALRFAYDKRISDGQNPTPCSQEQSS